MEDDTPTHCPGVALQFSDAFGEYSIATQLFRAGQVVVAEEPLIVSMGRATVEHFLKQKQRTTTDLDRLSWLLAFGKAPYATQQAIKDRLYCPEPQSLLGTPMYDRCIKIAELVADCGLWQGFVDPSQQNDRKAIEEAAMRILLTFDCNTWSYNAFREPLSALYHYGSKFTHTCGLFNSSYFSRTSELPDDLIGKGCWVAQSDIQPGDLLTVSYFGVDKLVRSGPARYDMLALHAACILASAMLPCLLLPWYPCMSCMPSRNPC